MKKRNLKLSTLLVLSLCAWPLAGVMAFAEEQAEPVSAPTGQGPSATNVAPATTQVAPFPSVPKLPPAEAWVKQMQAGASANAEADQGAATNRTQAQSNAPAAFQALTQPTQSVQPTQQIRLPNGLIVSPAPGTGAPGPVPVPAPAPGQNTAAQSGGVNVNASTVNVYNGLPLPQMRYAIPGHYRDIGPFSDLLALCNQVIQRLKDALQLSEVNSSDVRGRFEFLYEELNRARQSVVGRDPEIAPLPYAAQAIVHSAWISDVTRAAFASQQHLPEQLQWNVLYNQIIHIYRLVLWTADALDNPYYLSFIGQCLNHGNNCGHGAIQMPVDFADRHGQLAERFIQLASQGGVQGMQRGYGHIDVELQVISATVNAASLVLNNSWYRVEYAWPIVRAHSLVHQIAQILCQPHNFNRVRQREWVYAQLRALEQSFRQCTPGTVYPQHIPQVVLPPGIAPGYHVPNPHSCPSCATVK